MPNSLCLLCNGELCISAFPFLSYIAGEHRAVRSFLCKRIFLQAISFGNSFEWASDSSTRKQNPENLLSSVSEPMKLASGTARSSARSLVFVCFLILFRNQDGVRGAGGRRSRSAISAADLTGVDCSPLRLKKRIVF